MRLIYNLSIHLLNILIDFAAAFNLKARKWVQGRRGQFKKLRKEIDKNERIIWFHCASLGEFEQGRPVMEAVRKNYSDHKILLTFFSPSGYEVRKNATEADFVFYLPLDTAANARKFIEIARPRIAVFVKYEFWFNCISELSKNKIPTLVVSAIFRPSQYFFKPWGFWSLGHLQKITHFFVQDEQSLELLHKVKIYHADIGGDTRFDRVLQLASENWSCPEVETFGLNQQVIVAGSTWPADEDILLEMLKNTTSNFRLILAPHEVSKTRIDQVLKKFKDFSPQRYSKFDATDNNGIKVMIIDNMGMLSYLYRYAKIAYVGGGFGVGIHNLLEAVTYGIPVIFGPNYQKFREASKLKEIGGGFPISNAADGIEIINQLANDSSKYRESADAALTYVKKNSGATQMILDKVKSYLIAD